MCFIFHLIITDAVLKSRRKHKPGARGKGKKGARGGASSASTRERDVGYVVGVSGRRPSPPGSSSTSTNTAALPSTSNGRPRRGHRSHFRPMPPPSQTGSEDDFE